MGRHKAEPCPCIYCGRPARYPVLGLCEAHHARMKRGSDMARPLRPPPAKDVWDRLTEAAVAWANAETDEDYNAAHHKLRRAAVAYAEAYSTPRSVAA